MQTTPARKRRNMAPLNLAMGLLGLLCIAVLMATQFFSLPRFVVIAIVLALFASLGIMFFTRKADEYTLSLWTSAANAAFAVVVAWLILGPFFFGVYEGIVASHEGREAGSPPFDMVNALTSTVALCAFYLTFSIKRLFGAF